MLVLCCYGGVGGYQLSWCVVVCLPYVWIAMTLSDLGEFITQSIFNIFQKKTTTTRTRGCGVPRIMLEDQQRTLTGRQTDPIVAWPLTNTFTNTYRYVPSMNGIVGSGAGRSWGGYGNNSCRGIDSGCTLVSALLAAAESIELSLIHI